MSAICKPKNKQISANQRSLYNLIQLVKNVHALAQYKLLLRDIELGSKENRRKRSKDLEMEDHPKKSRHIQIQSDFKINFSPKSPIYLLG